MIRFGQAREGGQVEAGHSQLIGDPNHDKSNQKAINNQRVLSVKKAIPEEFHFNYKRWLRYYVNFCLKNHYKPSSKKNLPHFKKEQ